MMNFIPDLGPAPFPCITGKMSSNSFLNVDRFANINNIAVRIVEIIYAGQKQEADRILLSEDWAAG